MQRLSPHSQHVRAAHHDTASGRMSLQSCTQRVTILEAILADVIHAPFTVIVPPLPIIRTEGDTVLTGTTIGLSHQVVAVPVKDRDPLPTLKEPQAFCPPIMDAHPGRPVIGLEDIMQITAQDSQFSGICRHGKVSSPENTQFLCTIIDLKVLEDQKAFALSPPAPQTTCDSTENCYYTYAINLYGDYKMPGPGRLQDARFCQPKI